MDLSTFAADVGDTGPVTIAGLSTRGGAVVGVRVVAAPRGIEWIQADEMTTCVGTGTPIDELSAALAEVGQRTVLPDGGTIGGALAVGASGIRRLGDGPMRDALLQARYVSAAGDVVTAGGPTVKNVSGFDVCRLLVGSRGTLGFLGEVILRTRPLALHSQWYGRFTNDPDAVFAALHRPVSVLWDGSRVSVLLEGHPLDVAEQAAAAGLAEVDGPPAITWSGHLRVAPSALSTAVTSLTGPFVAEMGLGVVHVAAQASENPPPAEDKALQALSTRVKQQFDPAGRLNPGVGAG